MRGRRMAGEVISALCVVGAFLVAWVVSAAAANDPACAEVPLMPIMPDWLERLVLLCGLV